MRDHHVWEGQDVFVEASLPEDAAAEEGYAEIVFFTDDEAPAEVGRARAAIHGGRVSAKWTPRALASPGRADLWYRANAYLVAHGALHDLGERVFVYGHAVVLRPRIKDEVASARLARCRVTQRPAAGPASANAVYCFEGAVDDEGLIVVPLKYPSAELRVEWLPPFVDVSPEPDVATVEREFMLRYAPKLAFVWPEPGRVHRQRVDLAKDPAHAERGRVAHVRVKVRDPADHIAACQALLRVGTRVRSAEIDRHSHEAVFAIDVGLAGGARFRLATGTTETELDDDRAEIETWRTARVEVAAPVDDFELAPFTRAAVAEALARDHVALEVGRTESVPAPIAATENWVDARWLGLARPGRALVLSPGALRRPEWDALRSSEDATRLVVSDHCVDDETVLVVVEEVVREPVLRLNVARDHAALCFPRLPSNPRLTGVDLEASGWKTADEVAPRSGRLEAEWIEHPSAGEVVVRFPPELTAGGLELTLVLRVPRRSLAAAHAGRTQLVTLDERDAAGGAARIRAALGDARAVSARDVTPSPSKSTEDALLREARILLAADARGLHLTAPQVVRLEGARSVPVVAMQIGAASEARRRNLLERAVIVAVDLETNSAWADLAIPGERADSLEMDGAPAGRPATDGRFARIVQLDVAERLPIAWRPARYAVRIALQDEVSDAAFVEVARGEPARPGARDAGTIELEVPRVYLRTEPRAAGWWLRGTFRLPRRAGSPDQGRARAVLLVIGSVDPSPVCIPLELPIDAAAGPADAVTGRFEIDLTHLAGMPQKPQTYFVTMLSGAVASRVATSALVTPAMLEGDE